MPLFITIVCFIVLAILNKIDIVCSPNSRIFTDEQRARLKKINDENSKIFDSPDSKSFKMFCEIDDIAIEKQKKKKSFFVTQEEIDRFFLTNGKK